MKLLNKIKKAVAAALVWKLLNIMTLQKFNPIEKKDWVLYEKINENVSVLYDSLFDAELEYNHPNSVELDPSLLEKWTPNDKEIKTLSLYIQSRNEAIVKYADGYLICECGSGTFGPTFRLNGKEITASTNGIMESCATVKSNYCDI